ENVALGSERVRPFGRVDWRKRRERASALLERLGAKISPDARAGDLGAAEKQLVEIARALGGNARVVVFDEPTASLPEEEAGRGLELVGRLRSEGGGVVYVSHRLEEVLAIADRVTVLRDGAVVATLAADRTSRGELVKLMVGRPIEDAYPK